MKLYAILGILIWNIIVMLVYGFDKSRAIRGGKRVREATLILCSYLLGSLGAMFGMVLFNHKTSKMKFRLFVPLSVIINVTFLYVVAMLCMQFIK